jgi:flagellar hook-associated protein 3 FlgL
MRVTQGMISSNLLRNLSNNYSELNKYMNQLQTGKKIDKPSDDPLVAIKGMNYRTEVSRVQQYQRNLNEVENWYDNTDSALDKATSALQRVRELAIQASSDTNEQGDRESIRMEVEQLKMHLVDVANTNVNDKFIFNGTNTDTPPFNDQGQPTGELNNEPVMIAISDETTLQANLRAEEVFGGAEGVFATIDRFITRLENGENVEASISDLDEGIDQIINARADLGARMNRLDLIDNRLSEQEILVTRSMSENEDVDYAEAITNLITQESIHRAALAAGSRIIQPSLVDFLR